ncbi:MAG: hypothetical protein R6W96_08265 [Clostridia bacterium]
MGMGKAQEKVKWKVMGWEGASVRVKGMVKARVKSQGMQPGMAREMACVSGEGLAHIWALREQPSEWVFRFQSCLHTTTCILNTGERMRK